MSAVVQGSDQWFALRAGKVTASRLSDMLSRTGKGWGAGRRNYCAELVVERLTGIKAARYSSAEMQWGTEQEPNARNAYAFFRDVEVTEVGFIQHPVISMSGASPDGLVGTNGLVEIKCPNTATHIATLLDGSIQERYILQMQWQMACTGRDWCDFVSFDPRMPADMQFFCKRLGRSQETIDMLFKEVEMFLKEVDTTISTLKSQVAA